MSSKPTYKGFTTVFYTAIKYSQLTGLPLESQIGPTPNPAPFKILMYALPKTGIQEELY